jgi:hypothetical protein
MTYRHGKTVALHRNVPADVYWSIKAIAVEKEQTFSDVYMDALSEYIARNNKYLKRECVVK